MSRRPEDNETFVRFVQAAREDGEFAHYLRNAGKVPHKQRMILLDQMAAKMKHDGLPEEIVEVVLALREDAVFKAVLKLLDAPGP